MPASGNDQTRTERPRWLARLSGALFATAGALLASIVQNSASAATSASDGSLLERRIEAVRKAADATELKPGKDENLKTAQWRNWSNWPNWGNYWPNWGNY